MSSAHAERGEVGGDPLRRAAAGLARAVALLTIVPVPTRALGGEAFSLAGAPAWFPLVGGAVGAFAGGLRVAFDPVLGRGPSTVLGMVGLVLITGALHQDGLADTADGLGVRGDRGRRLAVMRDSRTGVFGVLALIAWALLLFTTLDSLGAVLALRVLVVAAACGRLAAVLHGLAAAPARRDGLGAGFAPTVPAGAVALLVAGAIALGVAGPGRGLLALGAGGLVALLSAWSARRGLGGSTGDTLGAAVAISELGVCLALSAAWH